MNQEIQHTLSSAQTLIWLSQLYTAELPCYNIGFSALLMGKTEQVRLNAAINYVISQSDALRISINEVGASAQQQFHQEFTFTLPEVDFSQFSDAKERARDYVKNQFNCPFAIYDEALWRMEWVKFSETEGYWFICCHHLVADGFALSLILRAVSQTYSWLGTQQNLTALNLNLFPYQNFIGKDQSYLSSNHFNKDRLFWQKRFTSVPEPLFTQMRNTYDGKPFGQRMWKIPRHIYQKVSDFSAEIGCSTTQFFMVILAVYYSRLNDGREELVIGMPVYNRRGHEQKNTIGMFCSMIPVHVDLAQANSFEETLIILAAELKRIYRHQRFPMSELKRLLPSGATSKLNLYDILISVEDYAISSTLFEGLTSVVTPIHNDFVSQPLTITVRSIEQDSDVLFEVHFDLNFFSETQIEADLKRIENLTLQAIDQPEMNIGNMSLISLNEQVTLLETFNDSADLSLIEHTWLTLFTKQVQQSPSAIVAEFENEKMSYAELDKYSTEFAQALLAQKSSSKVAQQAIIAVLATRSIQLLIMMVGVLKSGSAYLPLDPDHPESRWLDVLKEAEPDYVIVDSQLTEQLCRLKRRWIEEKIFTSEYLINYKPSRALSLPTPALSDLAYIIYTSGSTGKPKGVMIEHCGMINNILSKINPLGLSAKDVIAQTASQCFDISVWQFLTAPVIGAKMRIFSNEIIRDPESLLCQLATYEISIWEAVPSMLQAALLVPHPLSKLRWVLPTGEALVPSLVQLWFVQYPDIPLMNAYGPAECSDDVAFEPIHHLVDKVYIGRPVANARLHLVDDKLNLLPIGVVGEIAVSGPVVGRGYLNRNDLTDAVFKSNPFCQTKGDERLYLTGDLARRDQDGRIEYVGRKDYQVKIRGFRIELGEIEQALLNQEQVAEAVVTTKSSGQSEKYLVAYVVLSTHIASEHAGPVLSSVITDKLKQNLSEILPDYMLPKGIILLDKLPLSANGKIDRKALPEPIFSHFTTQYLAPETEIEKYLCDICQQILGIEQVGINDNFLQLGGHSLMAVQVISRLRQAFKIDIPLNVLFNTPVLADVAAKVSLHGAGQFNEIKRFERTTPPGLSSTQLRLWYIEQIDKQASLAYHMLGGLRIYGDLNQTALLAALDTILDRHDILRTRFSVIDGTPKQIIDTVSSFKLQVHDISEASSKQYQEIYEQEMTTPFDLSVGPLMRGRLLLGSQEYVLLVTMHHIISDGWSMEILIQELSALYTSYNQSKANPLPPLLLQYADFSQWQEDALQEEHLQEQALYWLKNLTGAPEVVTLPTDRPRPKVQDYSGASLDVVIDADLTHRLKVLSRTHGVTIYMTLLAAWSAVVNRLSSQNVVVIGSPNANRNRPELESIIGFFANTQAMRIDFSDDLGISELLAQVKKTASAAQEHQDIPFEQVVKTLNPTRTKEYNPLFQLMFTWQSVPEGNLLLDDLHAERIVFSHKQAKFELTLDLREENEQIVGSLSYATALFDAKTVQRFLGYLKVMLAGMTRNDVQKVSQMSLLRVSTRTTIII